MMFANEKVDINVNRDQSGSSGVTNHTHIPLRRVQSRWRPSTSNEVYKSPRDIPIYLKRALSPLTSLQRRQQEERHYATPGARPKILLSANQRRLMRGRSSFRQRSSDGLVRKETRADAADTCGTLERVIEWM